METPENKYYLRDDLQKSIEKQEQIIKHLKTTSYADTYILIFMEEQVKINRKFDQHLDYSK